MRSKHALTPPIRQLHFIAERCEVHEAELGEGRPTGKLDEYVLDLLGVLADDFVQLQDFLGLRVLAEKFHSHVLQVVLNAILGCVFIICNPVCENTSLFFEFTDDRDCPDVLLNVWHRFIAFWYYDLVAEKLKVILLINDASHKVLSSRLEELCEDIDFGFVGFG